MNLKPCPHRHAGDDGNILCDKIKSGDREVSPNICRACPISQINCAHLRATLDNPSRPPIIVRWGNGKTQVWDDVATQSISMQRAACAAKVTPIHSPRDCAGCALRQPLIAAETIAPTTAVQRPPTPVARRPLSMPAPTVQPVAPVIAQPAAEARSSVVAQKIIQLQEWLAKQKTASAKAESAEPVVPVAYSARPVARTIGEEKRAGWTD